MKDSICSYRPEHGCVDFNIGSVFYSPLEDLIFIVNKVYFRPDYGWVCLADLGDRIKLVSISPKVFFDETLILLGKL